MTVPDFVREFAYGTLSHFWHPTNTAVVLTYHSISEVPLFGTVTPEAFAAQMHHLAENGFNVVSLSQLDNYRAAGVIPPSTIAITFDDGYRDNYTEAFPVLRKYGFCAAIFMLTSRIGGTLDRNGISFAMLSEVEIREMHDSGLISFESHTVSHPILTKLNPREVEREIWESKETLERLLNAPCERLAYPKSRNNESVRKIARQSGIHSAYTTVDGFIRPHSDPFLLCRNGVNATISIEQFAGEANIGRLTRTRLLGI